MTNTRFIIRATPLPIYRKPPHTFSVEAGSTAEAVAICAEGLRRYNGGDMYDHPKVVGTVESLSYPV